MMLIDIFFIVFFTFHFFCKNHVHSPCIAGQKTNTKGDGRYNIGPLRSWLNATAYIDMKHVDQSDLLFLLLL